jgi:hypothetical protein
MAGWSPPADRFSAVALDAINLVRYLLTIGCPPVAQSGCRTAAKSAFQKKTNANASRNKLLWKWNKGQATSATEFADPRAAAEYALCVYGGASQALISSSEIVLPGGSAGWADLHGKGWRYKDRAGVIDGVQRVQLKAKGTRLPVPALPLPPTELPLLVQLVNSDSGICWESSFESADVVRNNSSLLKAKAQ